MATSRLPVSRPSLSPHVRQRVSAALLSLSDGEAERLRLRRRQYRSGEIIVRRGVHGGFVGVVDTGTVAIISYTPGGRPFTAPLAPGESFMLPDGVRCDVTIQAVTEATLWMLDQADIARLRSTAPTTEPAALPAPKPRRRAAYRSTAWPLGVLRVIGALSMIALVVVLLASPTGQGFCADVLYARGLHYVEQHQLEAAEHQFNAALSVNPAHAASYDALGYIYDQQGRGEEALSAFEHAVTLDAESDVAHNNLGVVQAHLGMTQTALANLQRAAELGINASTINVNLGNLYLLSGDWLNAGRAYREALRMNPRLAVTHYNLGFVYYRQQQFANAYGEFKRALELDPDLASAHVGLGVLDFERGDLVVAQAAFLRATELDSQDAVAYFYLGLTQKLLGEQAQSLAAFEQVLDLTGPSLIREQAERHLQEFQH